MPASIIRLRRSDTDMRIEIMPLIDVIFLLLTFFIYAMVLMIRAEVLPMKVPALGAGQPARPAPAVTLSLDRHGDLYLDREPVTLTDVRDRL
jgi:biopolymer transport protein ExbD